MKNSRAHLIIQDLLLTPPALHMSAVVSEWEAANQRQPQAEDAPSLEAAARKTAEAAGVNADQLAAAVSEYSSGAAELPPVS